MRELFANRDFRLLFAGLVPSMFGDSALFIVLAIWAKDLTGSNAAAGLTILAVVAPATVAPFVGFLVDRVRRRPFLLWTNAAAAVMVLPLLLVGPTGPVWLIYAVAFGYGSFLVLHTAAMAGLLKAMLPAELLGDANSLLQSMRLGMRLIAPLVGAGVYAALGGAVVAAFDAATFLVAAAVLGLLRVAESRPIREPQRLLTEMAAGARFLLCEPTLRRVVLALGAGLLLVGPVETAYFAVVEDGLGRPPSFAGVLLSMEGVGAVLGALTAPRIMRRRGEQRTVAVGLVLVSAGIALLIPSSLVAVVAGSIILGLGLPWLLIGYATLLQRRTPGPLMARVSTSAELILSTPNTLSIAAGALLIAVVDYRLLLAVAAGGLLATGVFLLRSAPMAVAEPEPSERGKLAV